jgi:hypothetical protein
MYINNKELSDIQRAIEKLQNVIEEQSEYQNRQFPEGIHFARELANDCEEHIERIYEREVRKRAKQIIKKRNEQIP